jgi:mannose-6-phosphate isomerase-like protein (cupin superfamily)
MNTMSMLSASALAALLGMTVALLPAAALEPAPQTASVAAPIPAAAPAPMPLPGSAGTQVSGVDLAQQIEAAIAKSADPAVAEVGVTDHYAIHEVRRLKPGPAAIHMGSTEVHLILAGGGTLVTGGKMIAGAHGNSIEGGVSHTLKKGDVFLIPENTPHMYSAIDGSLDYFEVRFATAAPAAISR